MKIVKWAGEIVRRGYNGPARQAGHQLHQRYRDQVNPDAAAHANMAVASLNRVPTGRKNLWPGA